mmetsp:Transcript_18402/g.25943  ORF Transcript_18402/g.25943 Transcript_18402/m.25943 type:complete len:325 (+) Transcript_18402:32-1006(+)
MTRFLTSALSPWVAYAILLILNESILETHAHDRREATVVLNGKDVLVEGPDSPFVKQSWSSSTSDNDDQVLYVLEESKPVLYIPNFLNVSTAEELQNFCNHQPGRWSKSPVRNNAAADSDGADDVALNTKIRTSDSCALVPAATYLSTPSFLSLKENLEDQPDHIVQIVREVDVAWEVTQQAASVLNRDPKTVEPLQLVRYLNPNAFYKVHHDHGDFYGKEDLEHRPWTILVFLNDVEEGGHTSFPKLDLEVKPRAGDAIAWSNVLVDMPTTADPDMVHAGEPPKREGIEKYAVNIWFGEDLSIDKLTAHAGQWSKAAADNEEL